MAATTVPRTAALYAPHPSIKPHFPTSLLRLPLIQTKQTYPKFHCSSFSFTPTHFSPKLLKRHRSAVCFASSGETTETQEVEEEIQDSQIEVSTLHIATHLLILFVNMCICLVILRVLEYFFVGG